MSYSHPLVTTCYISQNGEWKTGATHIHVEYRDAGCAHSVAAISAWTFSLAAWTIKDPGSGAWHLPSQMCPPSSGIQNNFVIPKLFENHLAQYNYAIIHAFCSFQRASLSDLSSIVSGISSAKYATSAECITVFSYSHPCALWLRWSVLITHTAYSECSNPKSNWYLEIGSISEASFYIAEIQ